MDVMCGWVWCEDVVSYHERGRLRPEGVRVIAHVHYVDGGTTSLCVWVLGAVRVYNWGIREGSIFHRAGQGIAR